MVQNGHAIKTKSTVISFEFEREKRLRNLVHEAAKATGRLILRSYNHDWNPIRDFRLSAAAAALFWRLSASGHAGIHTANVNVYELGELADSGILIIEGGERLTLGGDVAGFEVIEGEIPTHLRKRRNRVSDAR